MCSGVGSAKATLWVMPMPQAPTTLTSFSTALATDCVKSSLYGVMMAIFLKLDSANAWATVEMTPMASHWASPPNF